MRDIAYKITFFTGGVTTVDVVTVKARNINSGFSKALKRASEPLGNGKRPMIHAIEFWRFA